LTPEQWEDLIEKRFRTLDAEPEAFKTDFLLLLDSFTAETSQNPVSYGAYIGASPKTKDAGGTASAERRNRSRFTDLFKGGALCDYADFGSLLSPHKDAVLQALNDLLKSETGKEALRAPGAENLASAEDLNVKMTKPQFDAFVRAVRRNIATNLETWTRYPSLEERLLPHLLKALTPEQFQAAAQKEQADVQRDEETQKLRFPVLLHGEARPAGPIVYDYTTAQANTAFGAKKELRAESRIRRFEQAAALRLMLRDASLYEAAMQVYRETQAQSKEKPEGFPGGFHTNLKSLVSARLDGETNGEEREKLRRLKEKLDAAKAEEYALEFGLSGYEDLVLSSSADMRTALVAEHREGYEGRLKFMERRIANRLSDLNKLFDLYPNAPLLRDVGREAVLANMREMIVSLGDSSAGAESALANENAKRYGVSSWAVARGELEKLLRGGADAGALLNAENVARCRDARIERLRKHDDGLFEEILPYLLRHEKSYRTLCTGSDDETDALIAALAPPLTILRERYGNRRFVARQLCLKHAEAILNAGGETNWAARFETTEKQLTEYSNGNIKSVSKRIQEITKGGKKAPLIMGVLARNDDLLFRSIGDVSEAILPQIEENLKSLNAFIEGQTEEFSPARKAGFQMYLNDDIVSLKNKDFSLRLGAALGEFTLREKADNLERARAETRMRAREVQRLEVDFEKVKARASAPPDDANALASLKNAMYGGLSPVMFRNAGTDGAMPTQEQLAQARKEFESAYGKSGGPTAEQKEEARKREADAFGSASAYDEEVNAMLLERALFTKGAQLAKPVATALDELARFMKAQKRLTWPGAAEEAQAKPADPQAIASFIQYMGLFGGTPEEDGKYSEKQIREHLAAFSEKQDLLNRLRLIAPKDPLLVSEHADDARAVSYAVYVLSPEAFRPLAENRIAYFTRAVVACRCIDEVLAEKGGEIRQDERTSLKIGLREYFGAALLGKDDDFNAEAFKNDVRAQLSDADRRQYLQDSSSLLGGVHFLSLRESERTMSAMKNREDFEDFLNKNAKGNRKNRSRLRAYNSLDLQQRAIFALSLSMPGAFRNTGAMRSTEMAEDAHERREAARETQLFLAAYVKQEAHDLPHADYSAVIANLFGQGETLYEAVFDNALAFTAQIVKRRNDAIPKDWERLADPMESVLRNKGAAIPEEGAIANKDAFMAALSETADGKKTIRANLTERLSRLSEAEFNLLIYLLQDRTALDWSTGVNAAARAHGTIHGAANSEKRASVKERYVFDPTAVPPADSSMLRRALLCLRSYQIRDDTDLTQRRVLRAGDFAKGALDRKTFADEALLENALSFLEELNQEYVRVQAIQRAPDLIEYGGNEDAKRLYRAKKGDVKSRESLETLLVEQAAEQAEGRDNTAQLMLAGYFALSDKQKVLFIKALGRRDILDVSKQDINLNRFGYMDRDYANPRARDDLIDRYVAASEPLELTGTDCETAFESCLSAQVNDDASTEDILAALRGDADARGDVFTSTRKTAVDWKLFGRTVQFVRRAENERDVFLQDRELYRARGDVVQEGEFEFNAHYMRRNVHSAGNRFTRHLGRRTAERVKDAIPSPVNAAVRRLLGPEASNRINKMEVLQGEANEKGLKAVLETAVGYSAEIGETLETLSETPLVDRLVALAPEALTSGITEYTSLASTLVDTVNNVVDSVKAIKGKMNLNDAEKRGAAVQSLDERETAKAALRQSAEQKTLSDAAAKRNVLVTRLGIEKGRERTSDVLITATAELISAGIGLVDETNLTKVLQVVVEEAGELINLLRSYFNDKTSIGKFFENESALKSYGEALRAYFGIDSEKIDRVEMARLAMGFENYTETASYVGLNITRGLLFSAGRQNPVAESRILALAVLDVIGCADSAGKQDDETANEVYKALMGGKYR
ncbi:MAG: hypothetical protein LBS24_02560, partial [Clostridiales Family XIII bacterium]|nr:hypothetical protein [Clostridiales Family XIII bacterium]